jgi:hypothetical protein
MSAVTADRARPATLIPAARQLYSEGKSTAEVLASIYGVHLPRELFAFHEAFVRDDEGLRASWLTHPWELMIPLAEGGPALEIGPDAAENEAAAFAQAPHVLLLCVTGYNDAPQGGALVGYDLNEVRQGRSTIVGIPHSRRVQSGGEFIVFGPSLVDVFSKVISDYKALMERWMASRARAVGEDDLDELSSQLQALASLRKSLAK